MARKTGLPPLIACVPHAVKQVQVSTGISLRPGHVTRRTECLQKFEDLFGNVLKESDMAVFESGSITEFGQDSLALPNQWKPKGRPWGEGKTFSKGKNMEDESV